MRWYRGHYAVGDGNVGVYRGGTHDQCANRCASNSRCIIAEYYFGNEGIKCNLYSYLPEVRWNTSQDAIIGVWE